MKVTASAPPLALVALALLALHFPPVAAADYAWTNGGASATFTNFGNFNPTPSGPFSIVDRVTYATNGSRTLTFDGDLVLSNLFFNQTAGTATMAINSLKTLTLIDSLVVGQNAGTTGALTRTLTGTLAVTNAIANASFIVGDSGKGTFTFSAGRVLADQILVGRSGSGNGTFNQNAAGTGLTVSNMVVGQSGTGLYSLGSTATNNVTGQMVVGQNAGATGTVTVSSGLLAVTNLVVATNAGSVGTFTWGGGAVQVGSLNGILLNTSDYLAIMTNVLAATTGNQTFGYSTNMALTVNGLVLGASSAAANGINQTAGTLAFTNTTHTAQLVVGQTGSGAYTLSGAATTLWVDQLLVTNNSSSATNSSFTFTSGTLGTLNGSQIVVTPTNGASFKVGGTWNMLGGTNILSQVGTTTNSLQILGKMIVSGPQTVFTNATSTGTGKDYFLLNQAGATLVVSNGAQAVFTADSSMRLNSAGTTVMVAHANSALVAPNFAWRFGNAASFGALIVSNNALFVSSTTILGGNGGLNTGLISDGGVWTNFGSFSVGQASGASGFSSNNSLTISSGGKVYITTNNAVVGEARADSTFETTVNNSALVTGPGSLWSVDGNLSVGSIQVFPTKSLLMITNNSLTIADGGIVVASNVFISAGISVTNVQANNQIIVSGGSLFATNATAAGGALVVGQYGQGLFTLNSGTVTADKLLVTNTISTNAAGPVANTSLFNFNGGTLTVNRGTVISNTFAFTVGNGTDPATFTMNGGTNRFVDGLTVANHGRIVGNGALSLQGGQVTIQNGGQLLLTNGNSTVAGSVTNAGTITVANSKVTYNAPVVISGGYLSDPSTNTFTTNVTVTASGYLQGSNGDLFVFYKDLLNQSAVNTNFSLWRSAVLFTNGAGTSNHTYDVTGSGSANWGTGFTNFDRVSTNFAIGQLSIAAGNRLMITGQVGGGITNAVYVGWLDIQGLTGSSTGTLANVSNTLVAALSLPDINLYYDITDSRNDWLTQVIPGTGYDLWGPGGGMLLPIPEPSGLAALALGAGVFVLFRRLRV